MAVTMHKRRAAASRTSLKAEKRANMAGFISADPSRAEFVDHLQSIMDQAGKELNRLLTTLSSWLPFVHFDASQPTIIIYLTNTE